MTSPAANFPHLLLGRMAYADAYAQQTLCHERVLAQREHAQSNPGIPAGFILSVEHPAVITISRRAEAADHLLASCDLLATQGIGVEATDRGGDITYHGPGQLVLYPIIDLNRLGLGLHDYMRLLEQSVIDACAQWSVATQRDAQATGVWVGSTHLAPTGDQPLAKIAAFGVRVRRWISMHGLALNVRTNLAHYAHIVPCGLHGRPVTSLQQLLPQTCPTFDEARDTVVQRLQHLLQQRLASHQARGSASQST